MTLLMILKITSISKLLSTPWKLTKNLQTRVRESHVSQQVRQILKILPAQLARLNFRLFLVTSLQMLSKRAIREKCRVAALKLTFENSLARVL